MLKVGVWVLKVGVWVPVTWISLKDFLEGCVWQRAMRVVLKVGGLTGELDVSTLRCVCGRGRCVLCSR